MSDDFASFKISFVDVVETVCKSPQMYTMNGSFGEALAFLEGYANGAKLGHPGRSGSHFYKFGEWLRSKMNRGEVDRWWEAFRDSYRDEATALREFARLYREHEEGVDSPERYPDR